MSDLNQNFPSTLAIGLGANLPSHAGEAIQTLIAVRPQLEKEIKNWLKAQTIKENAAVSQNSKDLRFRWSPLYRTKPWGVSSAQPDYINAVVVIDGLSLSKLPPTKQAAVELLKRLLDLEKIYGRDRSLTLQKWNARSLDLDLLVWGGLQLDDELLTLPHPRLIERSFVIIPLGAALSIGEKKPQLLPTQENWI